MGDYSMNKYQNSAINEITKAMTKGGNEVKFSNIEDKKYFISFVIETGMPNDEGTAASLICRDRRHFFIGKRGGIKLVSVSQSMKTKDFYTNEKIGKSVSFFDAIHTLAY
jgi:hypothetical protein